MHGQFKISIAIICYKVKNFRPIKILESTFCVCRTSYSIRIGHCSFDVVKKLAIKYNSAGELKIIKDKFNLRFSYVSGYSCHSVQGGGYLDPLL